MLSNAQRALIKATVPLLETGGEALITLPMPWPPIPCG